MKNDLKHLEFLYKAATSLNLLETNPILFKVAVNDYRYYKNKFKQKHKKNPEILESEEIIQNYWKYIKHPYLGNVKYGFKTRKQTDWYNIPWNNLIHKKKSSSQNGKGKHCKVTTISSELVIT